jgi:hypothetical protein
MSLKIPGANGLATRGRTGLEALDYEIVAEMATSLGAAGRKVEALMMRLGGMDRDDPERGPMLRIAAEAVHHYFIQRELCGLRRHNDVIREYRIPNEVLARLGAK